MARTAVVKIDGAYYLEKYSPDGREVMERHPVAYSEREYEEYRKGNRCSVGYHWVKGHTTKDGVHVEGHCAKNPYGSTQKLNDLIRDSRRQGIGPYNRKR